MALNDPYAAYRRQVNISQNMQGKNAEPPPENRPVVVASAEVSATASDTVKPQVVKVDVQPGKAAQRASTDQYLENRVMMASPAELTLMLYDGSIRFMTQFIIQAGAKDIAKAHTAIVRAQDIFTELLATLDMEQPISQNLAGLYVYFNEQLMQANLKKDPEPVKQVIEMTRELRNTWCEAMKTLQAEAQPKKAASIDVRLDALPGAGT